MIKEERVYVSVGTTVLKHYLSRGYSNATPYCKLSVLISDLPTSSYAIVTAICSNCSSENKMTYNKYIKAIKRRSSFYCYDCNIRINQKENALLFFEKVNDIHKSKYTYNVDEFTTQKNNINIICPIHGNFIKKAYRHLTEGCPKCTIKKERVVTVKKRTSEWYLNLLTRLNKAHNNKFEYPNIYELHELSDMLEIVCPIHGKYKTKLSTHLCGYDCKKCSLNDKTYTVDEYISKCLEVHDSLYDYSSLNKDNYQYDAKIPIICKQHGIFLQTAAVHIAGKGCKKCTKSKGEIKVKNCLNILNIKYIEQHTFNWLVNPRTGRNLTIDFYLPELNMVIEYDGKQHNSPYSFYKETSYAAIKKFMQQKYRDNVKNFLIGKNKIDLLRIPYTIKNIHKYIEERLKEKGD